MALTSEERDRKAQQICNLTQDLVSPVSEIGDWKVAKCYEYSLMGKESPYDLKELHAKRQAVRDEINRLQEELAADEAERGAGDAEGAAE